MWVVKGTVKQESVLRAEQVFALLNISRSRILNLLCNRKIEVHQGYVRN
jgi:hypothetical protein